MATNQTVSESSRAKRTKRVSTNQNHPQNPLVNLPEDILENVFSFLPIKDAIEAATVSTRFKRSWLLNRKFLFGRDFALRFRREELIKLIERLFNSHKGPQIQSFQLHIDPNGIEVLIDKWLRFCIAKGIEDLEFYFFQRGYNLDADFIDSLKSLRTLKLVYCEIQFSPVLKSLKFLNTLVLWHLELTEVQLETLIFNCKFLEILDLCQCSKIHQVNIFARNHRNFKMLKIANCPDLEGIEIDAPTLRSIFYCGFIPRIRFALGVSLNEAFFNFMPTRTYMPASEVEILVTDLRNVRVLTTSALFLEALAARVRDGIFGEAKFRLWNLRELQLFMEGGIFCNPYDIVMFLKNCPCLEALFIDMNDYQFECGMYWQLHQKHMVDNFNHYFNRLRMVKLKGFKFLESELILVKILLQKALFLDALIFITPKNGRTKLHLADAPKYNRLFHSWKASPTAKIVLYEHFDDRSCIHPAHPKCWY